MSRTHSVAAAILWLCVIVAAPVGGQTPAGDSLPLRKGQWAIEATIGGYGPVGVLRFLSSRSALILEADANTFVESNRNDITGDEQRWVYTRAGAELGRRLYTPLSGNAATILSAGLSASFARQGESYRRETRLGYGIFAEAGGVYFLNRRLSVQVTTTMVASFIRGKTDYTDNTVVQDTKTRGYSVSPLNSDVVATFYFR